MKAVLISIVIGFAAGGSLDNGYLSPSSNSAPIAIIRSENINNGDGSYSYAYETENGIAVQEKGQAPVDGSFSYTAPNGQKISITYVADENGFHPQGSHLPAPPPIPEAILKSIEFNVVEEARGKLDIPSAVLPLQEIDAPAGY